ITSTEKSRRYAPVTTVQAVDGRTFRDIATLENTSLELNAGRLPDNTYFMASRATPLFVQPAGGAPGILVRRLPTPQPVRANSSPFPVSRVPAGAGVNESGKRVPACGC